MSESETEDKSLGCGLGLGVFFLPFVFAWFTLREGYSTTTRVLSFGWLGLFVVSAFVNPPSDSVNGSQPSQQTAERNESETQTASANPSAKKKGSTREKQPSKKADDRKGSTRKPQPSKPSRNWTQKSCSTLVKRFGSSSNLTDLQKEKEWPKYKGKAFRWKLEVVEVSEELFGGYEVQAKCRGSTSFVQDVSISYGSDAEQYVMQLKKGGVYELTGTLDTYSGFVGIMADGFIEKSE